MLYFKLGERWDYKILTNETYSYELPLISEYKYYTEEGKEVTKKSEISEIAVSAVDRISNESIPAIRKIN